MGYSAASTARTVFFSLLTVTVILYLFGYTFVMEAAPSDWVGQEPSVWHFLCSLRSNENPAVSFATFYICFPLLLTCFAGFLWIALRRTDREATS